MTEYEIADLAASKVFEIQGQSSLAQVMLGGIGDSIQQFMTVLFGYIAAAYFVGSNLERRQMWILTALYTLWQCWMIVGISLRTTVFHRQLDRITELRGSTVIVDDTLAVLIGGTLNVFLLAALISSLYFMWSVRHPKTE